MVQTVQIYWATEIKSAKPTLPKNPDDQSRISQVSYGHNSANVIGSGNTINISSEPTRLVGSEHLKFGREYLAASPNMAGPILIEVVNHNRPSKELSIQLHNLFSEAGWTMVGKINYRMMVGFELPTGCSVAITNPLDPHRAEFVISLLGVMGITNVLREVVNASPDMPPDLIDLYVWPEA